MINQKLVVIFIIVLFTACAKKGAEGGECLPGNQCAEAGLRCAPNGTCQKCGIEGRQCCAGDACSGMLTCTGEGFCENCGWEGEQCCSSDPQCINSICAAGGICRQCGDEDEVCCPDQEVACKRGYCSAQGVCVATLCDENGNCSGCGSVLGPCCSGGRCNEVSLCSVENVCEPCGSLSQQPCAGGACRGWLVLMNGVCDSPFSQTAFNDASVCLSAYEGYDDKSQRDWCYWYLAYSTGDASACNSIEWQNAQTMCLEGDNPDDYYVQQVLDFSQN